MEELLKKLFVITTIAITFLSSFSYLVLVRVFKGISFGFTVRKLRLLEVKLLDRDPYIYLTPESGLFLFYCIIQLYPF